MPKRLFHFHEKDLMPLHQGFFLFEVGITGSKETVSNSLDEKMKAINSVRSETNSLEAEVIAPKKTTRVSAVHHVKDLIINNNGEKFDVAKFGKDPVIESIVREVTGKSGNTEISNAELQQIIERYPERAMQIRLEKLGQWGEFKKNFANYKDVFKQHWNSQKISQDFQKNGKNGMTVAGVTYGLSVLFGLGGKESPWYKELTNANAYKESAKQKWKIFLSIGLGAQTAGIPLMQTVGTGLRLGGNALGRASYTAAALFDSLLSPERWTAIVGGENVLARTPENLLKLLPNIKDYFTPEAQILLGKFYQEQTGKTLELTPTEINRVAQLTVALSDSLINNQFGDDTLKAEPWMNGTMQNQIDSMALALSRNPKESVRIQFQQAINTEIEKQKAYREDPEGNSDWKPLYQLDSNGVETGLMNDFINTKKFKDDFENGAKKILAKMTKDERKSVLEMATSHGISGLILMAWVFIQGTLLAVQGGFALGEKILGAKEEKTAVDEKAKSATRASEILEKNSKDLARSEWKTLLSKLVIIGAINKKVLKKLGSHKKYKELFDALKKEGAFNIKNTNNIKDVAIMQSQFKSAIKGVQKIALIPLGEVDTNRKSAIKDLYFFHKGLKSFTATSQDNYSLSANGFWGTFRNYLSTPGTFAKKRASEARKRVNNIKEGAVTTTGAANKIFRRLGVPESRLSEVKKTNKADKNRINEIIKLSEEVLGVYKSNGGESILKELEKA